MAQFKAAHEVKQLYLPSTSELPEADRAWVKMDISQLRAGDLVSVDREKNEISVGLDILADRIVEWNYTDATGNPMPITRENVELLDVEDFTFLSTQMKADDPLTDDEKKASLKQSLPEETAKTIPVTSQ